MLGLASSHRGFRAIFVLIVSILCFWVFQYSYKASISDTFLGQSDASGYGSVKDLRKGTAVPFGHHHPRNFSRVKRNDDDDLTFYQALCKGERLLQMLRTTEIEPPPFTAHDWDDNGWTMFVNDELEFEGDYPELKRFMSDRGISVSTEDNLRVEASVDRPFLNRRGKLVDPKKMPMEYMGFYANRYNTRSGAIVAEQNFSPSSDVMNYNPTFSDSRVRNEVPPLNRWSDVTWSVWAHFAENPANLRYIIRENIVNRQTTDIIDYVMDYVPQGEDHEEAFGMESEKGRALLGTPNGGGIAWLLKAGMSVLGEKDLRVNVMISEFFYTMIWEFVEEQDPIFG